MQLINGKIKEKRPNADDYRKALLRMAGSWDDALTDNAKIKKYLFLQIKLKSEERHKKPEYKTYEDIQDRLHVFFLLTDLLGMLTPIEFMQMFPIRKVYDGAKYEHKDYYSTMEDLKEYAPDQPIGSDRISHFLWDYYNDDTMNFEVAKMCCISDLRRAEGGQGLMKEFMHKQGFPTYTFHEKEGYMYNQLTGETTKIYKPKKRVPKFMSVVEGRKEQLHVLPKIK